MLERGSSLQYPDREGGHPGSGPGVSADLEVTMADGYTRAFSPDGVQAYFISFRCYGTWLHGDRRGSMERSESNAWGSPKIAPDPVRERLERDRLKNPSPALCSGVRQVVDGVIREVCDHRKWLLYALSVQEEHVHLVVRAAQTPEFVMNSLKSWITRRLREKGLVDRDQMLWSRHGSTKWLWDDEQVQRACGYVVHNQPLPPDLAL
jgi:REP element-mobilizing transposase RayT